MILATVLAASIIILIGVAGIKAYNLSVRGKFLPPIFVFLTLGLAFLALLGIMGVASVAVNKAADDAIYNPEVIEASLYLNFAWILLYLNFGLFLGELVMLSGVLFETNRGRFLWNQSK